MNYKMILILITGILTTCSYAQTPKAVIKVLPGTTVEVGEPVYFDGVDSYDDQRLMAVIDGDPHGRFEWDFGDGYDFRWREKDERSGVAIIHIFSSPGNYTVTLYLRDSQGNTDEDKVTITVTGRALTPGFEVLHAPFHARIAQYLDILIPPDLQAHRLIAEVTGDTGESILLLDLQGSSGKERVLLRNENLPAGNYRFSAVVLDGADSLAVWTETFSKPYNGKPISGIDENNAHSMNGALIFPIKPWMLNKNCLNDWGKVFINSTQNEGWYPDTPGHTIDTWTDYLGKAEDAGIFSVGPGRWEDASPIHQARRNNPRFMEEYIAETKDNAGILMWLWADETNMGGRAIRVYAETFAAWTYVTHLQDAERPVFNQMQGFDYLAYRGFSGASDYDYMHNAKLFGGKKHFVHDVVSIDTYPYDFGKHPAFALEGRGPIDQWVESIDSLISRNGNYVPTHQFLETQDVELYNDTKGLSHEELRMQIWLSVVHGSKGLSWFHYFGRTPPQNLGVLHEFKDQSEEWASIILGPDVESAITDDGNERGRRVDWMLRETNEAYYLFAVRLTEPEFDWRDADEPESVEVSFTLPFSNISNSVEDIFAERKMKYHTVDVPENKKSFQFSIPDTSIIPGNTLVHGNQESGQWMFAIDDGTGTLSGNQGLGAINGTINYQDGTVDISFPHAVKDGTEQVIVTYQGVNEPRVLEIKNNTITDSFARNAVHVYKINKNTIDPPSSSSKSESSSVWSSAGTFITPVQSSAQHLSSAVSVHGSSSSQHIAPLHNEITPSKNTVLFYNHTRSSSVAVNIKISGYYSVAFYDMAGNQTVTMGQNYFHQGVCDIELAPESMVQGLYAVQIKKSY